MSWEVMLKSSNREYINDFIKKTKKALFDMLLPTWEEDPMVLQRHIEKMFAELMEIVLDGSAEEQYLKYKYGEGN